MKAIFFTGAFLVAQFSFGQVYQLEKLNNEQVDLIRSTMVSMCVSQVSFESDTIINILKDIDKQRKDKKLSAFSVRLSDAAVRRLILENLGATNDISNLLQKQQQLENELRKIAAQTSILNAIREFEIARKIPDNRSAFERVNTGFLKNTDFKMFRPRK